LIDRQLRTRLLLTLVWVVPGIIAGIGVQIIPSRFNMSMSLGEALLSQVIIWMAWGICTPPILSLCDHFPFENGGWRRALLVHIPAATVVVCIQGLAIAFSQQAFSMTSPTRDFTSNFILAVRGYVDFEVVIYCGVVVAHSALSWHGKYREQEVVASQLEGDLARAQLDALRSQVNPHFLFNALNSVMTLTTRDAATAQRVIVRLSELLRFTLAASEASSLTLAEELEVVRRYLEIEQVRFGERLRVVYAVDPRVEDVRVPALVLQPIVENAITHGVATVVGEGRVEISCGIQGDRLAVRVRDNGPGPNATPRRPGAGIGLGNLQRRLERLYLGEFTFALDEAPGGGCIATMLLPLTGPALVGGRTATSVAPSREHVASAPAA